MAVTYKSIGRGCEYTISPLMSGLGEVMSVDASRKRHPVRSGLIIESDVLYQVGDLVQLDIKFPGQEHTYRSKGVVSWVDEGELDSAPLKMGITITGMDKLDPYGISVSLSGASEYEDLDVSNISISFEEPFWEEDSVKSEEAGVEDQQVLNSPVDDAFLHDDISTSAEDLSTLSTERMYRDDFDSWDAPPADEQVEPPAAPPKPLQTGVESIRDTMLMWPSPEPEGLESEETIDDPVFHGNSKGITHWPIATRPPGPPSYTQEEVTDMFDVINMLLPKETSGRTVSIGIAAILPAVDLPKEVIQTVRAPSKQIDLNVVLSGRNSGSISVWMAPGQEESIPSAYSIEQLLSQYTGEAVTVMRMRHDHLTFTDAACIGTVVANDTPLIAVIAMDDTLTDALCHSMHAFPMDQDAAIVNAKIPIFINQDRHVSPVMVPARISVVPIQFGTESANVDEIESNIVSAFERMQNIYRMTDADDAAKYALALARELIECAAGSCALIAKEVFELYIAAAEGPIVKERLGVRLPHTSGFMGFCIRTGQVAAMKDPGEIHPSLEKEMGFPVNNVLCAPIVYKERTMGAIELINSPIADGFSQSEANLLAYIGNSLGEFIVHSLPDSSGK